MPFHYQFKMVAFPKVIRMNLKAIIELEWVRIIEPKEGQNELGSNIKSQATFNNSDQFIFKASHQEPKAKRRKTEPLSY